MWVRSLGWKDSLVEGMVTHSSIAAWRIPQIEEPGRLQSIGSQRAGLDWSDLAHTAEDSEELERMVEESMPLFLSARLKKTQSVFWAVQRSILYTVVFMDNIGSQLFTPHSVHIPSQVTLQVSHVSMSKSTSPPLNFKISSTTCFGERS